MSICTNYNVVLTTSDNVDKDALIHRPRCKSWACEHCAEVNRKVWQARIGFEVTENASASWFFLTFTLAGYMHDSKGKHVKAIYERQLSNSLYVWRQTWGKLLKRLKREHGKFAYLRVFEAHKDGTLHVHMLCNARITDATHTTRTDGSTYWHSATIEAHLVALGLGYIHDAKPLGDEDKEGIFNAKMIASYVAKYLTKDAQSSMRQSLIDNGMGRIRLIQTSRDWHELPTNTSNRIWSTASITYDEAITIWLNGREIVDLSRGININDGEYFGDYDRYPNPDSEYAYRLGL